MSERLDDLVDVAPLGKAEQSSLSRWSSPDGAQAVLSDRPNLTFAFHTDIEENPWLLIDLLHIYRLQVIEIHNRTESKFWHRSQHIQIEISMDRSTWTLAHSGVSYFGGGGTGEPLRLLFAGQIAARFIRISLPERQYLHLKRVHVFVHRSELILINFWEKHGFNTDNRILNEKNSGFKPDYNLYRYGDGESNDIIGFKVEKFARFANNIMQTINALHIADCLNLSHVIAPKFDDAFDVSKSNSGNLNLYPENISPPSGLYVSGDFFYMQAFHSAHLKKLNNERKYDFAQKIVKGFLGVSTSQPEKDRSRELIIHIRSGDIFDKNPHPGYVQPPLSYYQEIVDRNIYENRIDSISIVYEDNKNPCVDHLIKYIKDNKMNLLIQQGNLKEDVEFIIGGNNLVFGFGTFGYGVCLLSEKINTLYSFEMNLFHDLPNINKIIIAHAESYIKKGYWKASQEQFDMMLSHPKKLISFRALSDRIGLP